MIEFPNDLPAPSVGSSTQHFCRILTCDFGDGYAQRALDGLNAHRCEWSISWSRIHCLIADKIEAFLVGCRGINAFLWTPPQQETLVTVICDLNSLRRTPESGCDSLSTVFTQVFDF